MRTSSPGKKCKCVAFAIGHINQKSRKISEQTFVNFTAKAEVPGASQRRRRKSRNYRDYQQGIWVRNVDGLGFFWLEIDDLVELVGIEPTTSSLRTLSPERDGAPPKRPE
jgi:hypothetical protein